MQGSEQAFRLLNRETVRHACDIIEDDSRPLGFIACRLGRTLKLDPVKEAILGDDEAQQLLSRQYSAHWGAPL